MVVIKIKENNEDNFPSWIEDNNISINNTIKLVNTINENLFLNTNKKHIEFIENNENNGFENHTKNNKINKYNTPKFTKYKKFTTKKRIVNFIKILKEEI